MLVSSASFVNFSFYIFYANSIVKRVCISFLRVHNCQSELRGNLSFLSSLVVSVLRFEYAHMLRHLRTPALWVNK